MKSLTKSIPCHPECLTVMLPEAEGPGPLQAAEDRSNISARLAERCQQRLAVASALWNVEASKPLPCRNAERLNCLILRKSSSETPEKHLLQMQDALL